MRFYRPCCICRAHRRRRGRETHVSKPHARALSRRAAWRGVCAPTPSCAREAGPTCGLQRVMRCHSACAGQWAAVCLSSGDVAFGGGTARALGVAAGPGPCAASGPLAEAAAPAHGARSVRRLLAQWAGFHSAPAPAPTEEITASLRKKESPAVQDFLSHRFTQRTGSTRSRRLTAPARESSSSLSLSSSLPHTRVRARS